MIFCPNYIAGKWQDTGQPHPIRNPADVTEIVAEAHLADAALAKQAVEAADSAWDSWRTSAGGERGHLLRQVLATLQARRADLAHTITLENGKTLRESEAEVDAAIKEATYQLDFVQTHLVETWDGHEVRHEPLGVALLLTPWNFPLATVLRKMVPALAAGNTVVLKPSELTPATAVELFRVVDAVGLPAGVANLVLGEGPVVGTTLSQHPAVRAISFTGSTPVGLQLAESLGRRDVRLQAEMGGANAVVVLADADLEAAAEAAVSHGFACCGQWCTGTSRVIVERSVYEEMLQRLTKRTQKIVPGNGLDARATMGPLISQPQLQKVESVVAEALRHGARLVTGGKRPTGSAFERGHFFEPTILADVTSEMAVAREEIFGPVLLVLPAHDADEARVLANHTPYGLAFSVFTQDAEQAERFVREVEAGVCHINLPTAYRDPAFPLLGWKDSGRGWPEAGKYGLEFFTRPKAVYRQVDVG